MTPVLHRLSVPTRPYGGTPRMLPEQLNKCMWKHIEFLARHTHPTPSVFLAGFWTIVRFVSAR